VPGNFQCAQSNRAYFTGLVRGSLLNHNANPAASSLQYLGLAGNGSPNHLLPGIPIQKDRNRTLPEIAWTWSSRGNLYVTWQLIDVEEPHRHEE
jgi:hypothetical protein